MKKSKSTRVVPKPVGHPRKIGAAPGFGPRHAENSKEGDLTQVNTDTVPALLTPREAVLTRNAAELAGRDRIEALNEKGNELAKKGVDLAGKDKDMKDKAKKLQGGSGAVGGFYPPGQGLYAGGTGEVGIGEPDPQGIGSGWGAPPQLSGQDLGPLVAAITKEAQKQGLNASQIQSILGAFKGMGGGAGVGGATDVSGGYYGLSQSPGGYQGGISDIGYPPFVAPGAQYHADKGGWLGPLDPLYTYNGYARGTHDVSDYGPGYFGKMANTIPGAWSEPGDLGFNTGPGGFGRPSTSASGNDPQVNRALNTISQGWGGGAPGFPWSPTMIPTTYNPQGYPRAVPAGPDWNRSGPPPHTPRKNKD